MPASAYALVATFGIVAVLVGLAAARLVGHRLNLSIGPQVTMWGWQVALPFDVAVALAAGLLAAALQRGALRLLQA